MMGSFSQSKRLKNLQNLKSGAIKLPRHWSKMLGLVNVNKSSDEEILQVSGRFMRDLTQQFIIY